MKHPVIKLLLLVFAAGVAFLFYVLIAISEIPNRWP